MARSARTGRRVRRRRWPGAHPARARRASAAGPPGRLRHASDGPRDVVRADLHRLRHTPVRPHDARGPCRPRPASSGRPSRSRSSSAAAPPAASVRMHRQGVDALDQVVAGRLAELLVGGDRGRARRRRSGTPCRSAWPNAVSASIVGPGRPPTIAADAARGREQRRRLALDRREVGGLGAADVVGVRSSSDLALAQPADGGGQQAGHLGAERRGDLRGPGQQEVAGEDRLQVAPAGVDALDAAAGVGLVDDVVVVERAEVDQLDRHAAEHHVVGASGRRVGARRRRRPRTAGAAACRRPRSGGWPSRSGSASLGARPRRAASASTRSRSCRHRGQRRAGGCGAIGRR